MFGWLAMTTVAAAGELDLQVSAEGFDLSVDADRSVQRLLSRMHGQHQDLLDTIRTKKALDDQSEGQLKAALEDFSKTFA